MKDDKNKSNQLEENKSFITNKTLKSKYYFFIIYLEIKTFIIYILLTHILFYSFYIKLYSKFSLSLKITFPFLLYIGHIIFLILSFSDPGFFKFNNKDSFHYNEVPKLLLYIE